MRFGLIMGKASFGAAEGSQGSTAVLVVATNADGVPLCAEWLGLRTAPGPVHFPLTTGSRTCAERRRISAAEAASSGAVAAAAPNLRAVARCPAVRAAGGAAAEPRGSLWPLDVSRVACAMARQSSGFASQPCRKRCDAIRRVTYGLRLVPSKLNS